MLSGEHDRADAMVVDQRRRRRHRRAGLGRDAAAHVPALVRAQGLQDRDARRAAGRRGGHQERLVHRRRASGPSATCAPRTACTAWCASRRSTPTRAARPRSPRSSSTPTSTTTIEIEIRDEDLEIADLPLGRRRRPARQQDRVGGAHHPHADRHRRRAARSERSQHKNRSMAMKMLRAKLYEQQEQEQAAKMGDVHAQKKAIEWGTQIRSYVLAPYRHGQRPPHRAQGRQRRRRARRRHRSVHPGVPDARAGRRSSEIPASVKFSVDDAVDNCSEHRRRRLWITCEHERQATDTTKARISKGRCSARIARPPTLRARGVNPVRQRLSRHARHRRRCRSDAGALPPEPEITAEAPRYAVAGRLVQVNEMGKARFLFLRGDRGEMIQLYVKADNADGVRASPRTLAARRHRRRARAAVRDAQGQARAASAEELRLLTKAIRPLPGKVLQEGARRHRRRAALPPALPRPDRRTPRWPRCSASARASSPSIRRFFDERGYVEVRDAHAARRPTAARRRGRSRRTTTRSTSISSCASRPSSISSGWSSVASIASTRSAGSSATRAWTARTTPSSPPSSSTRPTRPTKT